MHFYDTVKSRHNSIHRIDCSDAYNHHFNSYTINITSIGIICPETEISCTNLKYSCKTMYELLFKGYMLAPVISILYYKSYHIIRKTQ